jgi:hypothetical protein
MARWLGAAILGVAWIGLTGVAALSHDDLALDDPSLLTLGPDGATPQAGRYVDRSLGMPLTFSLDDGWATGGSSDLGIELSQDGPGSPYVAVTRFAGEVMRQPCATGDAPFDSEDRLDIGDTAEALVGFLAAHPYLTAEEPQPVTVAGYDGWRIDVASEISPRCLEPIADLWIQLFSGDKPLGVYILMDDVRASFVALDVEDEVIVIAAEIAAAGDFSELVADVTQLLGTMAFHPGA